MLQNWCRYQWMGPLSIGIFWICYKSVVWKELPALSDILCIVQDWCRSNRLGDQKDTENGILFATCREDFTRVTGRTQFPLSFCATRWIEDRRVADRLIEIWTQVVKIVDYWGGLGKKKRPSSKSYEHIKKCVAHPLIILKLHFFSYIAGLLEPFLKLY